MSKQEIIQYLFSMIKSRVGSGSLALMGVDLGIKLAAKKIDPIIVYNSISGFDYNELLTLLSYSFLYFNSFDEALMNIIHTTGDNDSLAFILGALFGGYNNQSLSSKYLNYVEGSAVDLNN